MEIWNEQAVEKSEAILNKLKEFGEFVLIGGWAVYLWTKAAKSLDIDLYANFEDFYLLQGKLAEKGLFIDYNAKLRKYGAKVEDIELDIYTPNQCSLIIPCKEVFANKWFDVIEGFKVIKVEPLLLLKLSAEIARSAVLKGFKDRCDILALIDLELDEKLLRQLFQKYDKDKKLSNRLFEIVRTSSKEYNYVKQKELNPREIKKMKIELIKKLMFLNQV